MHNSCGFGRHGHAAPKIGFACAGQSRSGGTGISSTPWSHALQHIADRFPHRVVTLDWMHQTSSSALRLPIEASRRYARRWAIVRASSRFEARSSMIDHSPRICALSHQTSVDCFAHAIPFAELTRALGDRPAPGHTPIFDVRFALQNHPVPDVAVSGMAFKLRMRSTGTARFHLGCEITEDGEALEVVWLFRPKLFPKEEINNLGSLFEAVLAQVARMPESRTAALTI